MVEQKVELLVERKDNRLGEWLVAWMAGQKDEKMAACSAELKDERKVEQKGEKKADLKVCMKVSMKAAV